MRTKKNLLPLLAVVFLLQLGVPAWMLFQREQILKEGEAFSFQTEPIDPVDPFRGRYVALTIDNRIFVEKTNTYYKGQRVYVCISQKEDGYNYLSSLHLEPPREQIPYLKTRITYVRKVRKKNSKSPWKVTVDIPFRRYYLNEKIAPQAEKAYRDANSFERKDAYVLVKILDGRAVLEELYIDKTPILEYLRTLPKEVAEKIN